MGQVGRAFRISRRVLVALLLLATVSAFADFVWPTLYRYDHISTNGDTYPVRINRLNGDADMLVPDEGWVPVEGDTGGSQGEPDTQKTGSTSLGPAAHPAPEAAFAARTAAPSRNATRGSLFFAFPAGRGPARMA